MQKKRKCLSFFSFFFLVVYRVAHFVKKCPVMLLEDVVDDV